MVATKLVVIVGETATGKTGLAINLAQEFNGEIISADSTAVRRGADIGTDKPSPEQRARAKHHLIDVIGPDEPFSAARFKELAEAAIADITARGRLPIMAGGSGLYVDSVIYDYNFVSKTDQSDREALRANTLVIGPRPDREALKQRIAERVDNQLAAGLEAEVRALSERYGWDCEALKNVGYAQWKGYFEGRENLQTVRSEIIRATVDLAKRQRTWFRRNKSIQWFDTPVNYAQIVDAVALFLQSDIP